MSWKSIACVAALGALTAPAFAAPQLEIVDNADGTGYTNVVLDSAGSIAVELTFELAGLTGVTIDSYLDEANTSDNPYIAGSPVGGDSTGLWEDYANDRVFLSYGAAGGVGTHKLFDFAFDTPGMATVAGNVAQDEVNNDGLSVSEMVTDGGGGLFGDFEPDGDVDINDFGVFAAAYNTVSGDAAYNPAADSEPDNDVDINDFGAFAANYGTGTAVTIPEPTAAFLAMIGIACLGARRSA